MTLFYQTMQATVLRLLTAYGEPMILNRKTPGQYNPATGGVGAATVISFNTIGHPEQYTAKEINNESILQGDTKVFLRSATTVPLVADSLLFISTNTSYRVMLVERISAQGFDIMYKLQVRI